ncbi:hypothetical protein Unana1_04434 [Umbelopsis nana]
MSSNVSLPEFDDHQFLVNSMQNSVPQPRTTSQLEPTNNDYSMYQQQPMATNLMTLTSQGSEHMFEPSFGYSSLSPRSSRLGSGATFSTDFGYLAADTTDHKQYNWLYDSMDAYMPTMSNVDSDLLVNSLLQQQEECFTNEAIETAIGGMSGNYVSMNDINSLVSDIDCKHMNGSQMRISNDKQHFMENKLSQSSNNSLGYSIFSSNSSSSPSMSPKRNRSFSPSETSNNSDDESDQDDLPSSNQSDMFTAWRNPPAQEKTLVIKLKKCHSSGSMNNNKSLGQRKLSKKSFTNLYLTSVNQAKNMGKRNDKVRRKFESPPNSARSTSSLSSLTYSSNALTLSDSIGRDLAWQGASEEEEEEEAPYVDDDDDEDDDEYRHAAAVSVHNHNKKGRNVDKACNHCKRSHLRCDDMRPCKRCVSTGKTGCKDVEHKPRGRPKIHKK